ncbi:Protein croquemort-like protein, partial [Dinothrombium tinctorium]
TLPIVNSSESRTFPNWLRIPFPITNHLYLFNISNIEAVKEMKEKPQLKQIGPFVYSENRHKVNISWYSGTERTKTGGDTVEYEQVKRFHFHPELSNGTLNDSIYHLNVALISAGDHIRQQGGSDVEYFLLNSFVKMTGSVLYPHHTAGELLFNGYEDPLITFARKFHFNVPYDKFGWFYGKNNTASDGKFRIFTGVSNLADIGKMFEWNGETKLKAWSSNCNKLTDDTPGEIFAPFTTDSPRKFVKIFVGEICRPLKLYFSGVHSIYDVKIHRYEITKSTFDYSLDENKCYCPNNGTCPANGLTITSSCQYGAPVGVSSPHFLYAAKNYFEHIDGLKPDPELHKFFIDIEPTLGIPLRIAVRMQINVLLERNKKLNFAKKLKYPKVYYPQIWFDVSAQVDRETAKSLHLVQNVSSYVQISALIGAAIGFIMFCFTLHCYTKNLLMRRQMQKYRNLEVAPESPSTS